MSGLLPPLSSRTSTMSHPTCCCSVSHDRCDRCDLLVDLEGFHLVAADRRECGLVLDIESCDRCVGCPGCGVTCSRSRARGGGGDRRALGRGPCADPVAQYGAGYAVNPPARSRPSSSRTTRCAHPGRVWVCGRSLGDPTVALRGSHHLGPGPPVRNHMEYRVVPYQAMPARRI